MAPLWLLRCCVSVGVIRQNRLSATESVKRDCPKDILKFSNGAQTRTQNPFLEELVGMWIQLQVKQRQHIVLLCDGSEQTNRARTMSEDKTTSTTTAASNTIYDVLYYKRAAGGKVHRGKNVSKMDGILNVAHSSSSNNSAWVTLTPAAMDNPSDDSDSEQDRDNEEVSKLSWNERRKRQRKSDNHALYSGRMTLDSSFANSLEEDTVLDLGGFQVQVVSRRRQNSTSHSDNSTIQRPSQAPPFRKPAGAVRTLLKSKSTVGSNILRPTLPAKSIVPGVTNRPAPQPKPTPITRTNLFSKKRPLVLSKQNHSAGATSKTISSNQQSRRPLHAVRVVGQLHSSSSNNNNNAITVTAAAPATTILPHIPLPASIRNVLRPHQITGVDFLHRTLTEQGGCILGDEMGLGVS